MITILHGDDIEASRAEFRHRIESARGKELREISGKSTDMNRLTQALESSSLFSGIGGPASGLGGQTLVVIENLFGPLGRKGKLIEQYVSVIAKSAQLTDIIIWEDKELGSTVLKGLADAEVKLYKIPSVIFQLLDGMRPQSASVLLPIFQKVMALQPSEILYVMLVRRTRHLMELKDGITPEGLASWQASRLTAQSRLFTMNELISLHTKLLDMDIAIKTGSSPFTLAQCIEQVLISL